MTRWGALLAALVLGSGLAGCASSAAHDLPENTAETKIEILSHYDGQRLLREAQQKMADATVEFVATPTGSPAYTGWLHNDVRRLERPAPKSGEQTVQLEARDRLCFNRALIPEVKALAEQGQMLIKFDDNPWLCEKGSGLSDLMSNYLNQLDLRWRLNGDSMPVVGDPVMTQIAGEPALRMEIEGLNAAGPAPIRPFELWVNGDGLPVQAEADDVSWTVSYPDTVDPASMTMPKRGQSGGFDTMLLPSNLARRAMSCGGDPLACPELARLQQQIDEFNAD